MKGARDGRGSSSSRISNNSQSKESSSSSRGSQSKSTSGKENTSIIGACIPPGQEICYSICGTTFKVDRIYKDLKPVGKGSYGIVCSAVNAVTGENVAIKRVSPISTQAIDAKHVLREIRMMRYLGKHENIITLKDLFIRDADDELYIVMELLDSDLHRIIQSKQSLSEAHHRFFMHQLLKGLKFLHDHRIIHRDLKPGNLLVTRSCELRITDFGLARARPTGKGPDPDDEIEEPMTEHVVTRWYRPPELMLCPDGLYNYAVDMWSVGCIFAELLGRKPLFPGKNFVHQLTLIFDVIGAPKASEVSHVKSSQARRFLESVATKKQVHFATLYPDTSIEALNLLESLLVFDPFKRLTVDQALAHPYFDPLRTAVPVLPTSVSVGLDFSFEQGQITKAQLKQLILREIESFRQENEAQGRYGPLAIEYLPPAAAAAAGPTAVTSSSSSAASMSTSTNKHSSTSTLASTTIDEEESAADVAAAAAGAATTMTSHTTSSSSRYRFGSSSRKVKPAPPPAAQPLPPSAATGHNLPTASASTTIATVGQSSGGGGGGGSARKSSSFFSSRGGFDKEKTKGILGAVVSVTRAVTSPSAVATASSSGRSNLSRTHPFITQQQQQESSMGSSDFSPDIDQTYPGIVSAGSSMPPTQRTGCPGPGDNSAGFFSASGTSQFSASGASVTSSSADPTSAMTAVASGTTPPFNRSWSSSQRSTTTINAYSTAALVESAGAVEGGGREVSSQSLFSSSGGVQQHHHQQQQQRSASTGSIFGSLLSSTGYHRSSSSSYDVRISKGGGGNSSLAEAAAVAGDVEEVENIPAHHNHNHNLVGSNYHQHMRGGHLGDDVGASMAIEGGSRGGDGMEKGGMFMSEAAAAAPMSVEEDEEEDYILSEGEMMDLGGGGPWGGRRGGFDPSSGGSSVSTSGYNPGAVASNLHGSGSSNGGVGGVRFFGRGPGRLSSTMSSASRTSIKSAHDERGVLGPVPAAIGGGSSSSLMNRPSRQQQYDTQGALVEISRSSSSNQNRQQAYHPHHQHHHHQPPAAVPMGVDLSSTGSTDTTHEMMTPSSAGVAGGGGGGGMDPANSGGSSTSSSRRRVTVPKSPLFSVMSWQRKSREGTEGGGPRGSRSSGGGGRSMWR